MLDDGVGGGRGVDVGGGGLGPRGWNGTQGLYYNTSTNATPAWMAVGVSRLPVFGSLYDAWVMDEGFDTFFSGTGPLSGITASPTSLTVPSAGNYKVEYAVSIDRAFDLDVAIAIAVNGIVDPSTRMSARVPTDGVHLSGTAILSLQAGDALSLRPVVGFSMELHQFFGVGAQMVVTKLD